MSNNVKVAVKLRPRSHKEVNANLIEQWTVVGNSLRSPPQSFNFDFVFSSSSPNADVFIAVIEPLVESCKNGFNSTIFTYGEKASEIPTQILGKTYTMDGTNEDPGIKILAVEHLFKENQSGTHRRQFIIRVGYVEIYNEMIYDLLNRRQNVRFDHSSKIMSNTEVIVKDRETILKLLQKGNNVKTPTAGNERSTSHTVFQIIVESQDEENGSFQVSHLNFVDLDRSEGDQIQDESDRCVGKSMDHFRQTIAALSKGEKFRKYSKSELTRMLKATLSGKANIVIICNINPTALNQTRNTLTFGDEAQKAKTWPKYKKVKSDVMVMKKVLDELKKIESHDLSDAAELAELESIVLMEYNMQSKCHSVIRRKPMGNLRIRPFRVAGLNVLDKKYQLGEMDGKCVDSQSRAQQKCMALQWSDYYLERVGFELSSDMRRQLKYGKNLVGRSDADDDIDICIDSLECSRRHCTITVVDDESVSLTDLNSTNGTAINGVINKGQTVNIREGDVIAIVIKGKYSLPFFVGNNDCTVYRLRKFKTETMQEYNLDEDSSFIVISDDECDGTSYLQVKMEVEIPPPSVFVEVKTSTGESTVAESVEQNQSVKEMATTSGHHSLSDGNIHSGCAIEGDLVSFDDLDEIMGTHLMEVETSNLGNLAREMDMLANVQMENARLTEQFEQIKRVLENEREKVAEERGMAQLKIVAMAEENCKLTEGTKWLELQLAALTEKNNVLLAENSKLRADITRYIQEIELFTSNLTRFENVSNILLQGLNE